MSESPRETHEQALREIEAAETPEHLETVRRRYVGRKGEVTASLRAVSGLDPAERPAAGRAWNEVRKEIEGSLDARRAALEAKAAGQAKRPAVDISLPGRRPACGVPHVLRRTIDRLVEIFTRMGFWVADGPEVESERYNFEALNIPVDHPTRDEHDSFYLGPGVLLRTQMSPVQIHVMEKTPPPVRVISPGRCYRRDSFDASHSPFFFQMEGFHVAENVTLGDLKGTLREFVLRFFGRGVEMRFRGSFFPFTEPSLELDISCTVCGGAGCSVCKQTGWVEVLGCGMVHPQVLRNVGYDPESVSGYAFGMGPDRITMLRHRIPDIRYLYENDVRFLHQFRGAP
jgi:phenylalanyl-tRNA synthetase alpha chain